MRRIEILIAAFLMFGVAIASARAGDVAAAGPPPASPATTRDADPALWVLKDEDTTIYLFGTIHVLPPGLSWFDEAIAAAFAESQELRTEVVMPDDPETLVPVMMRYALDTSGTPLSAKLTPQQREAYRAGIERMGLSAAQLESFQPWFVGLQVSIGMIVAHGLDPAHGAEEALRAAARAQGKRMTAFETIDEQMSFMASTPQDEQIGEMMDAIENGAEVERIVDELVESWARGEPEKTGALMNESMAETPVTARVLLTDRNRRWAESLRARLAEPGTVFVAVGAGHLAGRDSVQECLAKLGLRAERVAY